MKYDVILSETGDWITGQTIDDETGEKSSVWTKMTDETWKRKFEWVVATPKDHIFAHHGIVIDLNTSNDLENLFEGYHPDLHLLLSLLKVKLNASDFVPEVIKLFLGPIAAHAKEQRIFYGRELINLVSIDEWVTLIQDKELKYNQKKLILAELILEGGLKYEDIRTKYVFDGITDETIEAFLIEVVKKNDAQWEKAKTSPALYNWFVGQAMKEYKGKVDAAKVMEIVQKLAG